MYFVEEPVYNATRRKSVFSEAYNPEDDEGSDETKVRRSKWGFDN